MVIVVGTLFIILFMYQLVKFLEVLLKMSQKPAFPINSEDTAIRKHPDRKLAPPTYQEQKWGIILFTAMLVFWLVMFVVGLIDSSDGWTLTLLLFIPTMYSHDLFNMFAVYGDGLVSGSRFIPWKNIKSYEFKFIDINHKYYGHSKEINDKGYELIIKQRVFSTSVIVVSEDAKEKLTEILSSHVACNNDKKMIKESAV
ncbi:hypothetical protein [Ornithinibacillus halophilus]|uniref:DUF5673 domain-containing protein n=1 Tax=Ornithinibacillus halophilus TaxID=930117 RepID=A0A1M5N178_9BACI|nr:hypothetical protein [Ornithinibacillus halophilus]SHG82743.1 hypothetical protein SAMN05216225_106811 [Ornithinibacillus halophilus]